MLGASRVLKVKEVFESKPVVTPTLLFLLMGPRSLETAAGTSLPPRPPGQTEAPSALPSW